MILGDAMAGTLKVQVAAVTDSQSRTHLKTARGRELPRGFESHAFRSYDRKTVF
jgi:hypothetical protein